VAQQIPQLVRCVSTVFVCLLACLFVVIVSIYRTPRRTLSQLEKYNFSGERENHWPGWCNHIKRTTTLLPSRSHFRKQTCDAIPLGRYGLRHTCCGHNSQWAFFELWHCSCRGVIYPQCFLTFCGNNSASASPTHCPELTSEFYDIVYITSRKIKCNLYI
jgi:hypothetical protein